MTSAARSSRRADEIRERRSRTTINASTSVSRRSATPRLKTKKRVVKSAESTPPPVMVRSRTPWGMTSERKHNKKARRRFDVALPMPGAEMRLPALPQIAIGWRVVSFGLVALLAGALYFLWNSPKFQVNGASVDGLQRVSSRDVETILGVASQPVFTLDTGAMRQKLAGTFPEFSAVTVKIDFPNSLVVQVTERKPVLTWKQDGKTDLVDASGIAFPLRDGAKPAPGPVVEAKGAPPSAPVPVAINPSEIAAITGLPPSSETLKTSSRQLMSSDMVTAILTLAPQIPQGTVMVYDSQHGLGWKDKRGWDVYFGDAQDIDNKLQVYKALVKYLQGKEIKPVLVSVEHVWAPYYRLEQ
jgi:cell division protein FtsQ